MQAIYTRNVCTALQSGLRYLLANGRIEQSRAGDVIVSQVPVTTVYVNPVQRVLTSPVRDANPFFHLAESLWMLAGRNDAAFLNNYVADFGERFAESASGKPNDEPGGYIHGAYGDRWRNALGFDQLDVVVAKLRANPQDRQCVIQMWDGTPNVRARDDSADYECGDEFGSDDLRGSWRDRPCNTHVYLRVRDEDNYKSPSYGDDSASLEPVGYLDLTVCCRSNDVIWGAYGANAVHFSVLQEYLAARIGVKVGVMYQVSNNFHAYASEIARLKKRAEKLVGGTVQDHDLHRVLGPDHYLRSDAEHVPLVHDASTFDDELRLAIKLIEIDKRGAMVDLDQFKDMKNLFLSRTVWPALHAHACFKAGYRSSQQTWAAEIEATDWRRACTEWLERRIAK